MPLVCRRMKTLTRETGNYELDNPTREKEFNAVALTHRPARHAMTPDTRVLVIRASCF